MKFGRLVQFALVLGLTTLPWLASQAPLAADKPAIQRGPAALRKKLAKAGKRPEMQQQVMRRYRAGEPNVASKPQAGAHVNPATLRTGAIPSPHETAAKVDAVIAAELRSADLNPAARTDDEDFLRRVSFDIAGVPPTSREVTLFGLDPDPEKRARAIDRLLASPNYATNWMRYWRDVIFYRATEARIGLAREAFEEWMAAQLGENKGWHEIATAMLTATGDVSEAGQTAMIFAQSADPDEVAAETSRIFLGIQLQCANCHDHPTDRWKREQFHGLAAFFPRIAARPKLDGDKRSFEIVSFDPGDGQRGGDFFAKLQSNPEPFIRRLDRDGDRKISRTEAAEGPGGGRLLERVFDNTDTDKDGQLSAAEMKKVSPPQINRRRGSAEYHMPDLNNPQAAGTKFDPTFFLGELKPGQGLSDQDRRTSLANYITSPDNPWFAKAFVNRIWAQLVGEGFYMPVDDIGPERTATAPAALDVLAQGFTVSGYDIKWLFRAIANSETYQRSIRARDPAQTSPTFAAAMPVRLRGDQLYDALTAALGIDSFDRQARGRGMNGPLARADRSPRGQFNQAFGFDPSTPPDEMVGTLPQALFFMNSPQINGAIRAGGSTRLAQILEKFPDNDDAIKELYLQVHAREPSPHELEICRDYLKEVGDRRQAFEDLQWSLLNSSEFQTKR